MLTIVHVPGGIYLANQWKAKYGNQITVYIMQIIALNIVAAVCERANVC